MIFILPKAINLYSIQTAAVRQIRGIRAIRGQLTYSYALLQNKKHELHQYHKYDFHIAEGN
jgi:hypothetical protein